MFTETSKLHGIGPNGETWTPTTTTVGEDFVVTATTQVTMSNWMPDDHGDFATPLSATALAPGEVGVPGCIDHAGDVDVFRVTPDISGTLLVRLFNLGLGMRPRIRLLAPDGTTVIKTLEFVLQGNQYFLTRVNAQARAPFYVEVSHINPTAVGGFYTISAGQPLPNVLEQPRKVFLPFVHR